MSIRKVLVVLGCSAAILASAWAAANAMPTGVFSLRHFLEGVAMGTSLTAAVVWLAVSNVELCRSRAWSWRRVTPSQRQRLLFSLSMGSLFIGSAIRLVSRHNLWLQMLSGALVVVSIVGNCCYLDQNRRERQGCGGPPR